MVHIPPASRNNLQIGDLIPKAGIYSKPGVISEKHEDGTVTVNTDPEMVAKFHRHTNTSGLTPEDKEKFNGIMDEIMKSNSNAERINSLQVAIDAQKAEGGSKRVTDTLRNEQAQLIRLSHELPRVFDFSGDKLKSLAPGVG